MAQLPRGRPLRSTEYASGCPDWQFTISTRSGYRRDADTAWRQRANEIWLRRTLDLQGDGQDLLLAGQVPLGEILAAPSAPELEAVSACLLDCDDETRIGRIRARGPEWFACVPEELQDHLNWAEWMRHHASNPAWRQHVIRQAGAEEMHWERWAWWHEADPRWRVRFIDTSKRPVERVVDELTSWIKDERDLLRAGLHPLGADALRRLDVTPRGASAESRPPTRSG